MNEVMLVLRDIKKSFIDQSQRRIVVLDVPNLEIYQGKHFAIEGHSGCGKTTLLHVISGILNPDAGTVHFQGIDVTAYAESRRDRWRACHVGYVFQTFNLLQGYTVLENILIAMSFGRGIDRTYALHLLEEVGLKDYGTRLPRELSTGQQQRVAVARALANKPQLVLADEPTGNLDARNASSILDVLLKVCHAHEASLVCVSHDKHILNRFDVVRPMAHINRALR